MPIARRTILVAILTALCAPMAASAAETRVPAEAVAMVKRVLEKFQTDGPEATFKAVTDKSSPEFHDGDLYPFVFDLNGVIVATGARANMVGIGRRVIQRIRGGFAALGRKGD